MFDLDNNEELSFYEPYSVPLKYLLGVGVARGVLRWGELMRMAAFFSVPLNPVPKEKARIHLSLACWMLPYYAGWDVSRLRTGLQDGYLYEMQQQAHLLSTYFTYDEQSTILFRLQKLRKSLT